MADWSSDTYYLGRLFNYDERMKRLEAYAAGELRDISMYAKPTMDSWSYTSTEQEILRRLQFQPSDYYVLEDITPFAGCAIQIRGSGKYGAGIGFTRGCFEYLDSGVIVYEGHGPYDQEYTRTIHIAGEKVFTQSLSMYFEQDEDDDSPAPWFASYKGRTPEEEHFFAMLWKGIDLRRAERHVDFIAKRLQFIKARKLAESMS